MREINDDAREIARIVARYDLTVAQAVEVLALRRALSPPVKPVAEVIDIRDKLRERARSENRPVPAAGTGDQPR